MFLAEDAEMEKIIMSNEKLARRNSACQAVIDRDVEYFGHLDASQHTAWTLGDPRRILSIVKIRRLFWGKLIWR